MKPGYKSSEFWLSAIATILGLLMASGALSDGTLASQIVGGALAILGSLGYTASRTSAKNTAALLATAAPPATKGKSKKA